MECGKSKAVVSLTNDDVTASIMHVANCPYCRPYCYRNHLINIIRVSTIGAVAGDNPPKLVRAPCLIFRTDRELTRRTFDDSHFAIHENKRFFVPEAAPHAEDVNYSTDYTRHELMRLRARQERLAMLERLASLTKIQLCQAKWQRSTCTVRMLSSTVGRIEQRHVRNTDEDILNHSSFTKQW
ncbi:unnamed protein product [Soboliphyme baturini]|uniref:Uncharacterized protein n=1 Tax=Soboliphyme baturini TaxID=241478 RepID=A0A183J6X9_9BILA|nr:unnamed protein product [Soboliphyme baturini]